MKTTIKKSATKKPATQQKKKSPRKQILETNGSEFKVTFTKKDGTKRKLVGHLVKGATEHNSGKKHLMVVFDSENDGFRTINLKTVTKVQLVK